MRSQNGNQFAPIQFAETSEESPKKSRIKYSRELLLSFCQLEICSKLPSGFDTSLLSEFEDASNSIPERPRLPGSLSAQNFRRGEYGSSPPTRGDSGSTSRGIYGRWDSRSSGSNDKDTDSLLDPESDSSRRYANQSRRPWQSSEHDGLLGSGSFPKSSGFASATVSKVRGNGPYPLSKTTEPYQPPRPYKAPAHSRRDATDIINEETFGTSESSSQDRVEEERKRRASFEQFRKEQRTFQEKPKELPDKHKENVDPDIAALLANSEDDKKLWDRNIKLDDMAPTVSQGDSVKASVISQISAPRPLVPPGFKGVTLEKNLATKSSISQLTLEVGNGATNESIAQTEDKGEKPIMMSSDGAIYGNSSFPKTLPSNEEGIVSYTEKAQGHDITGIHNKDQSTSIIAKLFGKASTEDTYVPLQSQSSKFTRWFVEEEKKPEDDLPSAKSEDLLSLIVNGDKDKDGSLSSSIFPDITTTSCAINTVEPSQGVLTCEDLEQSILSEFSDNTSNQDLPLQAWNVTKNDKRPAVDNHASQHLLSLLQKGPSVQDTPQSPIHENEPKPDNNLTLETLFGTAFMKELQSVKAPVSVQRGGAPTQSDATGFSSFPPRDDGFLPFTSNLDQGEPRVSNQVQYIEKEEEALEIQLPDEDSLITLSDPVEKASSSSMPVDIVDKLAALNAVLKKERSTIPGFDDPPFLRGPNNHPMEPEFPYGRHLFQPLDSRMSSPPDSIVHSQQQQHHFPANVMHPHGPNGPTRFSPPAHHPMLQQMHMQGNMLPPHLLRGLPRSGPVPPPYYAPEPNPMQNYPFGHHQQANYGQGGGSNRHHHHHHHPEALEKLFEMELRANLKQMHPAAAGHNLGTPHGHGLDTNFRYNR